MTALPPEEQRHPDAVVLGDLDEGLLEPPEAARVQDHVDGCAECAAVLGDLRRLRERLLALPAPGPMPADVIARLEAAFADEVARRADPAADPTAATARTTQRSAVAAPVTPLRPAGGSTRSTRHRTSWSTRVAGWGAAAAAAAVVGGLVVAALQGTSGGSDEKASASGDSAASGSTAPTRSSAVASASGASAELPVVIRSSTDYRPATFAALAGALRPEVVARRLAGSGGSAGSDRSADSAGGTSGDGRDAGGGASSLPSLAPGDAASVGLGTPKLRSACVRRIAGAAGTPVVIDVATYAGAPAAILVLPTPGSGSTYDVYAVPAGCPADVLAFTRVAR